MPNVVGSKASKVTSDFVNQKINYDIVGRDGAPFKGVPVPETALVTAQSIQAGAVLGNGSTVTITIDTSAKEAADASASANAAASAAAAASTVQKNARGQIIKKAGETAWTVDSAGKQLLSFKVLSIKPATCTSDLGFKPQGTVMAISLEIETSPDLKGPTSDGTTSGVYFGAQEWTGYGSDGIKMNTLLTTAASACLTDRNQEIGGIVGPGEKVKGIVLVDVTTPTGELAFNGVGAKAAWVWQYPTP